MSSAAFLALANRTPSPEASPDLAALAETARACLHLKRNTPSTTPSDEVEPGSDAVKTMWDRITAEQRTGVLEVAGVDKIAFSAGHPVAIFTSRKPCPIGPFLEKRGVSTEILRTAQMDCLKRGVPFACSLLDNNVTEALLLESVHAQTVARWSHVLSHEMPSVRFWYDKAFESMTGVLAPEAFAIPDSPFHSKTSEIEAYHHSQRLESKGRKQLATYQPGDAVKTFQEICDSHPAHTNALAYLSIATLLSGGSGSEKRAQRLALESLKADRRNALAHAALAQLYRVQKQKLKFEEHRRRANDLSSQNPTYAEEVRIALNYRDRRESHQPKREMNTASAGWFIAIATLGGLFAASNVAELGVAEYFYEPTDGFWFARRGALILAGLVGLMVVYKQDYRTAFEKMGWHLDLYPMAVAILYGLVLAYLSPIQRVTGPGWAVIGMTLLHVFAEEVFFRGFLTRYLLDQLENWVMAIAASALIFGLYHMTYYSFWFETALWIQLYFAGAIGVLAGIPYAMMYRKTNSLAVPLSCHLTTNVVMMMVSLGQR